MRRSEEKEKLSRERKRLRETKKGKREKLWEGRKYKLKKSKNMGEF